VEESVWMMRGNLPLSPLQSYSMVLSKRWAARSYHRVREGVSNKFFEVMCIRRTTNWM
jgi:hypothetical protein